MSLVIEAVNVGPIRRAKLSPGNLNVLIGANNTGKTFFATVIHRIFAARTEAYFPNSEPAQGIPDDIQEFVRRCRAASRRNGGDYPQLELNITDDMREWADSINVSTLQRLGVAARRGISYAYGMSIERLRRQPMADSNYESYIQIKNPNPQWSIKVPMGTTTGPEDIVVSGPNQDKWIHDVFSAASIERQSSRFESRWSLEKDSDNSPEQEIAELCQRILYMRGDTTLFNDWPLECLHLPSERGGIMQSYRAITSAALRKSSFADIERIEIEPLDGTARDFLSFVVSPESGMHVRVADDSFVESAADMERRLRAEIEIVKAPSGIDRIVARTPEGRFELNQTSSMISELASLLLALKHRLRSRDYLTIDEPEAHLHPEMQIEIAKLLVRLASGGLGVTLTTHSDYFVEQINNAIRSSELRSLGSKADFSELPQIDRDRVKALLFVRDEDGCVASDATGDAIDPIKEDTFTDASTNQYQESVPLINLLLEHFNTTTETAE